MSPKGYLARATALLIVGVAGVGIGTGPDWWWVGSIAILCLLFVPAMLVVGVVRVVKEIREKARR
jgi:hypothetical protein